MITENDSFSTGEFKYERGDNQRDITPGGGNCRSFLKLNSFFLNLENIAMIIIYRGLRQRPSKGKTNVYTMIS